MSPKQTQDAFERELKALVDLYNIDLAVLVYRLGNNLYQTWGASEHPLDQLHGSRINCVIDKALNDHKQEILR